MLKTQFANGLYLKEKTVRGYLLVCFLIIFPFNHIFSNIKEVDFRTQALTYHNPNYIDKNRSPMSARFKPTLFFNEKIDSFDEISLTFTPIWGRYWGNTQTTDNGQKPSTDDNQWGMAELSLKISKDNFFGKVGRNPLHYQEGIIWGKNDQNLFSTSYDSIIFSYKKIDLIYIHDTANNKSYSHQPTIKTFGTYSSFDWIDLFAYYYKDKTIETTFFHAKDNPEYYILVGSRLASHWQSGELVSYIVTVKTPVNHYTKKKRIDILLDFSLIQTVPIGNQDIKIIGKIFYAGPSYQNRYEDQSSLNTVTQIFSRRNLSGGMIGIKGGLFEKFNWAGHFFQFIRSNKNNTLYSKTGNPYDYIKETKNRNIGQEVNIQLKYHFTSKLGIKIDGGLFIPQKYIIDQYSKNKTYLGQLTIEALF